MTVKWPQADRPPRGGADVWDDGPAGVILRGDYFGAAGVTYDRQVAIASDSTLTAVGVKTAGGTSRAAQIDSVSSLTVVATVRRNRQAVAASASSLTVLATVRRNRQVVIASASSLAAIGARQKTGAAVIASTSSLTVRATVISRRAAVVASTSTLAVVAKVTRTRAALVQSASTLTALSRIILNRSVQINAVSALDATPEASQPIRRVGGADIQRKTRIKEWFLERQLKEFEETLAEIGEAEPEDATEAVEAAIEAFEPIAARVDDRQSVAAVRAISEALRTVADSRQARNAAVVEVEAQLAKIAAIQRRKRRDEAAILLLM